MARPMGRRLSLLLVVAVLPLALWAALPLISPGQSPESLQRRIEEAEQIESHKGRERVLTTDQRLHAPDRHPAGRHHGPPDQEFSLEADLEAKRAELAQIQEAGASGCTSRGCGAGSRKRAWSLRTGWSSSTSRTRPTW